jgi:hypothetical protein
VVGVDEDEQLKLISRMGEAGSALETTAKLELLVVSISNEIANRPD